MSRMSSSRHDDRRYSSDRRDRSYSSRRDRDPRWRSPIPGPSRGRSPSPPERPRDDNELPSEFGRPTQSILTEDDNNVLKRMKTDHTKTPLAILTRCVQTNRQIKVWVRNAYEIRGLCSGYLLAFDKHWNMCLYDVVEYYVKVKIPKGPCLDLSSQSDVQELKRPNLGPKIPTKDELLQKTPVEMPSKEIKMSARALKRAEIKEKMQKRRVHKREWKYLFIRGDSVVTFGLCDPLKEPIFFPS